MQPKKRKGGYKKRQEFGRKKGIIWNYELLYI